MKSKYLTLAIVCMIASGVIQAQSTSNLPKQIIMGKERVKVRKEIVLPVIDQYQLLKCDFHMHTIFSDGIVWPSLRVDEAWEEGLDAIAITDHIEGQPARQGLIKGNHNTSFEAAENRAKQMDMILIRAGEITRSMPPGHLNALFLKDVNVLDQTDYMVAIEEANKQGAFVFWNHPGWGVEEIKWYDTHQTLFEKGWLHGIEVFNEFEWYPLALNWAYEKNLTLISNTDVHDVLERLYDQNTTPNRPMTLVLAKERSEEGIKEALFDRRTILYFFDHLLGKEEWLRKFFDASVTFEKPHFIGNNRAFITIKNSSDLPFKLTKIPNVNDEYPQNIEIPARRSIVLRIPMTEQPKKVEYEVTNMITGAEEKLHVQIF